MGKVKGPLHSTFASGSIGDALTFSTWKGKPRVMRHTIPRNPRTISQQANRQKIFDSVFAWRGLTQNERDFYNDEARHYDMKMSGYNFFLSQYMQGLLMPTEYITDSAISFWYMDETGGTDVSDSFGAVPLTLISGSWVPGFTNNCLQFNGTSDYASRDAASELDFKEDTPFSIEFWLKHDFDSTGPYIILSKSNAGVSRRGYRVRMLNLYDSQLNLALAIGQNATNPVQNLLIYPRIDFTPLRNQWVHCVICYGGTSTKTGCKFFINGVEYEAFDDLSGTISTAIGNVDPVFYLGCTSLFDLYFKGLIDELLFYSKVLSQAEVTHNFTTRR